MPDLYQQALDFISTEKARYDVLSLDGLTLSEAGQLFSDTQRFLVQTVEQWRNTSGPQKKKLVVDALGKVYDVLLEPHFPWWMRNELIKKVLMRLLGGFVESFVGELPG